jgi:hypothetical protein
VAGQRPFDQLRPRARPTVWPGRRPVPGIVAPPDRGGARGADCLPLRRPPPPASSSSTMSVDPARRRLSSSTRFRSPEAHPPSRSPPVNHGGLGELSCQPPGPVLHFRSSINNGPELRSAGSIKRILSFFFTDLRGVCLPCGQQEGDCPGLVDRDRRKMEQTGIYAISMLEAREAAAPVPMI